MTTNYFAKLAAAAIIRVFSEPCEQGLVGINYRIRLSRCERGYGESRKRAGVRELVADERRRLPGDESVDRVGVIELEGSVVVVDAATVLALAALAVEVGPVGGGTVLSGHRGGGTVRELLCNKVASVWGQMKAKPRSASTADERAIQRFRIARFRRRPRASSAATLRSGGAAPPLP